MRGGGDERRRKGWNYNTALQVEAIEKPVWLKGSGLERIRDASYRHIDGERDGEIRDGREGRETEVET